MGWKLTSPLQQATFWLPQALLIGMATELLLAQVYVNLLKLPLLTNWDLEALQAVQSGADETGLVLGLVGAAAEVLAVAALLGLDLSAGGAVGGARGGDSEASNGDDGDDVLDEGHCDCWWFGVEKT